MMRKYKVFGVGCSILAALTLGACSDWDDHYEAETSLLPSQKMTLWETIKSNGELSQFASLLERVGYDKTLGEAQSYTIWAPKNNAPGFDFTTLSGLNDSVLLNDEGISGVVFEHAGDIAACNGLMEQAVRFWILAQQAGGNGLTALLPKKIKLRKYLR